jgi:hypothetical protein
MNVCQTTLAEVARQFVQVVEYAERSWESKGGMEVTETDGLRLAHQLPSVARELRLWARSFREALKASPELPGHVVKILCEVYSEMNAIRARDGAPPNVSIEYWDKLMERITKVVKEATGQGPWLHPCLYAKKPEPEILLTFRGVEVRFKASDFADPEAATAEEVLNKIRKVLSDAGVGSAELAKSEVREIEPEVKPVTK